MSAGWTRRYRNEKRITCKNSLFNDIFNLDSRYTRPDNNHCSAFTTAKSFHSHARFRNAEPFNLSENALHVEDICSNNGDSRNEIGCGDNENLLYHSYPPREKINLGNTGVTNPTTEMANSSRKFVWITSPVIISCMVFV
ncbi:hypothetical protein AVEN_230015-1 [Araneus ventricosus]|uniref:Uncharacterized protein n=1 Tax=Araneus ventricosus TaxID=182803 RepID=A0A4Y2CWD6_ARAVE|nr:hypothetical protein AVEN_230015-1 [Araneus ventricosus]